MDADQASKASRGTMKGMVQSYRGGDDQLVDEFRFESTLVHRFDDQGIGLIVSGNIDKPRNAQIYVAFKNDRQPSGKFSFPNAEIKHLVFIDGEFYPTYGARAGEVVFQNKDGPDVPTGLSVNGKLTFTTEYIGNKYFKVEVIFAVEGLTKGKRPRQHGH
jgi:hypothetical protein